MHFLYTHTSTPISDAEVGKLRIDFPALNLHYFSEKRQSGWYGELTYDDLIQYGGSFAEWFGSLETVFSSIRAPGRLLSASPYTLKELDHYEPIEEEFAMLLDEPDLDRLWEASSWRNVIWVFVGRDFAPDGVPSTVPRDHVDVVESDEGFWCRNTKARGGISWNHPNWRM